MQKLYPGIYQFSVPYLTYHRMVEKDGYHRVKKVDVEIHVGRKEDVAEGKLATVIAYSTSSFSNYAQEVFSNIRRMFFPNIFPMFQSNIPPFQERQIRYVEVHAKSQDLNDWHELEMRWDPKTAQFKHPVWNAISPQAWYYQDYQQKILYFAQQGLKCFQDINMQGAYNGEASWELQTETSTQLSEDSPIWLLQALHEAKQYVKVNELAHDPYHILANSLKKLSGLEINRLSYTPVITTAIVSQIHKIKYNMNSHYIDQSVTTTNIYAT
ncbi:hypothetical protein [Risungbinella massiliensis]|uniref:hypothetical protein n=1 Tax=Risungbinella massiliensis TaxID=1329796 RepID=UPI0005CC5C05|nr:hypothetical protein [Risungbinella massiliensis]